MTHPECRFYRYRASFRAFLVLIILGGLQVLMTMHLRMSALPPVEPAAERVEAFNPKLFEVMSFGQLPAVIDWMWMNVLVDPLTTHVKAGAHPQIFYTLDLVTDLDPVFMEAYIAGATVLSVIRDDGPGALHILLKGEAFRKHDLDRYGEEFRQRYWYREWQLPMLLAYVQLFDMDDMPRATEAFEDAARVSGSPPYLQVLIAKLKKRGGQYEVGIKLLHFMLSGAKEPEVRRRLEDRLRSLEVNYFLFDVNDRFHNFLDSKRISKDDLRSNKRMESLWELFRKSTGISETDPWGGRLSIDARGYVTTTTEHQKVFGLE